MLLTMQGVVYVNGRITSAAEAAVPVFDHGFLYGEGVYETLRTYTRVPFLFEPHMARLRRSAGMIALTVPMTDDQLRDEVGKATAAYTGGAGDELYIRMLLTRGVGDLSYNLTATPTPTLVIIVKALPVFPARCYRDGIRVALVDVRRNPSNALNPLIKSNNLLNNALAMQEAYRRGADEALMQNQAGHIVECSQSNFFVVRARQLLTPPLTEGLLPGITRQVVIDIARELGIATSEVAITPANVMAADEAFITGTTRELTPVTAVDDSPVGNGRPGPITAQLLAAFRAKT